MGEGEGRYEAREEEPEDDKDDSENDDDFFFVSFERLNGCAGVSV